jgi:protein-S-isoprenylcysteine O-methyltransferase Ste14
MRAPPMRFLELRIPPPIVALAFAAVAWAVARATPALALPGVLRIGLAVALVLAGLAFVAAGVRTFRRAETTIHPLRPEKASAIVSSGVFAITRNPMYLGLVLVLVGWAVLL